MKAAFTVWNNRIAPLFDVARQIHIVESDGGRILTQSTASIESTMPIYKVRQLAEMGVGTLVCGAISRSLQSIMATYGIELFAFVDGDLQEVIRAWQRGKLNSDAFLMPGCRFHDSQSLKYQQPICQMGGQMKANQGEGRILRRGPGGRKGRTPGGRGRDPKGAGGLGATAANTMCICPQCGNQEPHQRGVPCMQKRCANCGAVMMRQ